MRNSFDVHLHAGMPDDEFLAELNAVFVRAKIEELPLITLPIEHFRRLIMLSHDESPIIRTQKSWTLTIDQLGAYLSHPRSN